MPWGPSTVRAELARLEDVGLLEHPHTSAGPRADRPRLPRVRRRAARRAARCPCRASGSSSPTMRREVDEAMRATTEQLSQVTNLLALVTAPPIETATIRRVEVLLLQPQVAMVVVITSTGGVTKRVISYDAPVDPGLVDWAGSYLNEALGGLDVGVADAARRGCPMPSAAPSRSFLGTLAPAFTELEDTAGEHAVRGGRRAAPVRAPPPGADADRRDHAEVLEHRARAARRAARVARGAERVPADRQREPGAGAALAERWWPRTTGWRAATSAPCR